MRAAQREAAEAEAGHVIGDAIDAALDHMESLARLVGEAVATQLWQDAQLKPQWLRSL